MEGISGVTWLLRTWRWLRGHRAGAWSWGGLAAIGALALWQAVSGVQGWLEGRDDATRAAAEAEAALADRDARIAALEAELAARAEAAAVLRAHNRRLESLAAERAGLIRDLQSMEGADAPLSDYLRDAAGRLWGQPASIEPAPRPGPASGRDSADADR
jgi:hypothetical protein